MTRIQDSPASPSREEAARPRREFDVCDARRWHGLVLGGEFICQVPADVSLTCSLSTATPIALSDRPVS
jgi:hypothetical protein